MNIEWITVQSSQKQKPKTVDETSSEYYVYLRRNIVEKNNDEQNGEIQDRYEYEEAKLTHEEYKEYLKHNENIEMQQLRADIDYIALCSGIDLEM